jgi:hypothetical protein
MSIGKAPKDKIGQEQGGNVYRKGSEGQNTMKDHERCPS